MAISDPEYLHTKRKERRHERGEGGTAMKGGQGEPLRLLGQFLEVLVCQGVWGAAQVQLKHFHPGINFGQGNVNSLLKSTADGGVKSPGNVCGPKNQHSGLVVSNT